MGLVFDLSVAHACDRKWNYVWFVTTFELLIKVIANRPISFIAKNIATINAAIDVSINRKMQRESNYPIKGLSLSWSLLKRKTHDINLSFSVPAFIELSLTRVEFHIGNFERNSHVGLSRKQDVLVVVVRRLDLLLVGRHETVLRFGVRLDLRVLDLKQNALTVCFLVLLFFVPVDGFTDLYCAQLLLFLLHLGCDHWVSGFTGNSSCQIRLMLFSLCVRQVAAFIWM